MAEVACGCMRPMQSADGRDRAAGAVGQPGRPARPAGGWLGWPAGAADGSAARCGRAPRAVGRWARPRPRVRAQWAARAAGWLAGATGAADRRSRPSGGRSQRDRSGRRVRSDRPASTFSDANGAKNDDLTTWLCPPSGPKPCGWRVKPQVALCDVRQGARQDRVSAGCLSSGRHFWPFCGALRQASRPRGVSLPGRTSSRAPRGGRSEWL